MIHKLIFVHFVLLLLPLTVVRSHFHSTKEFESTLTRCCEIGTDRAARYPTSLASVINVTSQADVCYLGFSEDHQLNDVAVELRPQCLSVIQHCCVNELNKQTCRFSKSLVKERLDSTAFSLNKGKKSSAKPELGQQPSGLEEKYYRQCMTRPMDLPSQTSNLTQQTGKLFHRIVQFGGSQTIFSECCVACKLGLFSALNDYKCIIQRSLKPSKLFEETFYDCCFNLKRELNLTSGKMVDISSMEALIYPELSQIYPSNMSKANEPASRLKEETKELVSSQSLVKQEASYLSKQLEQVNRLMPSIRTEFVPDFKLTKEVKDVKMVNLMNQLPDCPKGMRLDERNTNICVDDNCQRNQHRCKGNEKCINTNPGFKCVSKARKSKPKVNAVQPVSEKLGGAKTEPAPQVNEQKLQTATKSNRSDSAALDQPRQQKNNHLPFPNPFAPYQKPPNYPPPESHNYLPNPYQKPPNRFAAPNYNQRFRTNSVQNNMVRFSKRKLIDKCAIGNHNCETQTQTCRRTENDFICVNNQDLAQYDRMNPYSFDDNPLMTTVLPPALLCPPGFEFNIDTKVCADINECETGAHNCSADYRCDNKIGSFVCTREQSCGTGYTYNQDTKLCEDINECRLNLHQCKPPYSCVNLIGSFRCELSRCKEGYRLLNNRCTPVTCLPGFRFNPLSEKCVDQDECMNGIDPNDLNSILLNRNDQNEQFDLAKHERLNNGRLAACPTNERCVNLLGGFICESPVGRLNELMGEDDQLSRRYAGAKRDDTTRNRGAPKKMGHCITEADYSAASNADKETKICGYKCVQSGDEWTCECPDGYSLKRDGSKCAPIDRCKLAGTCQANEVCVNLRGSHKCVDIVCPPGYTKNLKNSLQCVIVDKAAIYLNKPKYISFSYLSLQSNVSLDESGEVRIASIRGATNFDFDYALISVESSASIGQSSLARAEDFQLKRAESDHIYVKRSLVGPQEIKLEFTYTTSQNNMKIIMNRLLLTIYVSKYTF